MSIFYKAPTKILISLLSILLPLLSFSSNQWTRKADCPAGKRHNGISASANGKGYVGLGYNSTLARNVLDFWEYDPAQNSWQQKSDFPGPSRNFAVAFTLNNKIYVGTGTSNFNPGSTTSYNDFYMFDPVTNTWVQKANFPGGARYGATCFTIGNYAYVTSGINSVFYRDIWRYDPISDSWLNLTSTPFPGNQGYHGCAFVINNIAYFSNANQVFWSFDPANAASPWSQIARFPGAFISKSKTFVVDGEGYIVSGFNGSAISDSCYKYSPITNTWSPITSFPGGGRAVACSFTIGNKGYFGHGFNNTGGSFDLYEYGNASITNGTLPVITCAGAFIAPNLYNGLVGWWPFCGDADDESGNGNNGTVNGATLTMDRFGNSNSAYDFDGISNYITIPNNSILNPNSITISGWINSNSNATNGLSGAKGIVTKWYQRISCNNLGDNYNVQISLINNNSVLAGGTSLNNQLSTFLSSQNNVIGIGNWKHFVFIHDNVLGQKLYVNGILLGANNANGNLCPTLNNLLFGAENNNGSFWRFFSGKLDDIGIWNRALDSSEVSQLYNTGLCIQTIAGSCDTLIFDANLVGFNPITYANQVKVYPNPAADNLVIDCGTNYTGLNGYSIRITNLLGQTVYNSPVTAQITNIQLTPPTWVNGTYVVQFVHPNGTVMDTKRIIIQ